MAETSAEERRIALRRYIAAHALKVKNWAERANVKPTSIYNFLNGHSMSLADSTYAKLAQSEGIPVEVLTGEAASATAMGVAEVVGRVKSSPQQIEEPEAGGTMWVPIPEPYKGKAFSLIIEGDAMDQIYPDGSVVVCVEIKDVVQRIQSGDRVVAKVAYKDGHEELILREALFDERGGKQSMWLLPKSNDPRYTVPVNVTDPEPRDIESVSIHALVIGSYVLERHVQRLFPHRDLPLLAPDNVD